MLNYYLVVVVICIVARYTHEGYSTPIACEEPNTDNNLCKNNCSDQCPTVPRKFCTRECGQGCFCKQDYSRAPNGTCVPTENCPVDCFDEEEVFGKRCDDTCYEDIVRCASTQYGCFCKPGLKRIGGVCAPEANCFNCGENEIYNECTNPCIDKCPGPEPNVCADVCSKGCACKENYKRDLVTNECIPIEDCKVCGENEVYGGCSNQCFDKCPGSEPTACAEVCELGCACKENYKRDPLTNECIPIEDCYDCGENEIYSNCSGPCVGRCPGSPILFCPRCLPGCVCQENYKRDPLTNECIPIEDCKACGENQIYSNCSNPCFDKCSGPVPMVCPEACTIGCGCQENYKRDNETNECVPIEECNDCGEKEVFVECKNRYVEKCPGPEPTPFPMICERGCACEVNYRRDAKTNKCVLIQDCNVDCPANSTYNCICNDSCEKDQIRCIQCLYSCGCDDGFSRIDGTCQPDSLCPTPSNDTTCQLDSVC